jgi:hypothetical protein
MSTLDPKRFDFLDASELGKSIKPQLAASNIATLDEVSRLDWREAYRLIGGRERGIRRLRAVLSEHGLHFFWDTSPPIIETTKMSLAFQQVALKRAASLEKQANTILKKAAELRARASS